MPTQNRQYSDAVLDSMQLAYGDGFLSPGGAEETRALLEGLPIADARCLDFGSGVGGAAILMVDELGAGNVVGVDVEQAAIDRANTAVATVGLSENIQFRHIEPDGALPFHDASFDIAITKDVICHVRDKAALFAEILRVLQPGGTFNIADWTIGPDNSAKPVFAKWEDQLNAYGLLFEFESVDAYAAALDAAGFTDIETTDHTSWSIENTRQQVERALGPSKSRSTESLGSEGHEKRTALTRARLAALEADAAGHWLLRAYRPY